MVLHNKYYLFFFVIYLSKEKSLQYKNKKKENIKLIYKQNKTKQKQINMNKTKKQKILTFFSILVILHAYGCDLLAISLHFNIIIGIGIMFFLNINLLI